MIKAIITDLDRTLLHSDLSISGETEMLFKQCKDRGIVLGVATARPERTIAQYQNQIDFDGVITLNGARTVLGSRVLNNSIPRDAGLRILEKLEALENVMISLETDDGFYSNAKIPYFDSIVVEKISKANLPEVFYKIIASSETLDLNNYMSDILEDDVYCSVAAGFLFQIMDRKATKWNGIKILLNELEIDPKDVVYFGDDNDDIESIKKCGIGAAVANAIDEVKAVADIILKSNDEDGVAEFIRENI